MSIIPFYGGKHPDLFAIERAAMDRAGKVISHLMAALPDGIVVDVGAGNGHTATALSRDSRLVIPLEPDPLMIAQGPSDLPWAQGDAESLPAATHSLQGAYATWAYFFPTFHDIEPGLTELKRVVEPGGPIIIIDNAGNDEFEKYCAYPAAVDPEFWKARGTIKVIESSFDFSTIEDATALLAFFGGGELLAEPRREIEFRIAVIRVDN